MTEKQPRQNTGNHPDPLAGLERNAARWREALELIAGQTPHDMTSKEDPGREHYLRTVLIAIAKRAIISA